MYSKHFLDVVVIKPRVTINKAQVATVILFLGKALKSK